MKPGHLLALEIAVTAAEPPAGPATPLRRGRWTLPGETTLIPGLRDMGEMVYVMMGLLLEMGWVPRRQAVRPGAWPLEIACPDL
ncbi:hypothetical protein Pve01_31650 [Planomonospora venezuelensis]|nr:hypothetical protein Pve01_31650 [Planomonospora venezuelensis]